MNSETEIMKLEEVVLSHILNNTSLYYSNIDLFNRGLFRNNSNCTKIFNAFKSLIDDGNSHPDIIAISERSKIGIIEVSEIFTNVDYQYDFKNSIQAIIANAIAQNLLGLSIYIKQELEKKTDVLSMLEKIKDVIASNEAAPLKRLTRIDEHIKSLVQYTQDRKDNLIKGIKTSLSKWDKHTGGLQPSDLIIIAGETSQGKTSLALTIAYNAAINDAAKIAIFSLEMSSIQLTARLTSIETKLPSKKLLFSILNPYDYSTLNNLNLLLGSDIYIDECTQSNIDYIVSGIKIAHMRYGIQVAVVDYIQLIHSGNNKGNEETELATSTRKLKNIAKELNITVIGLSQLSRNKTNPKPTLGRLRGSGQIEEAADIVALIWRPETYDIHQYEDTEISTTGTAEVSIVKGRNVGIGKFWLNYNPQLTYFTDIEE